MNSNSKQCVHFAGGTCKFGDTCKFLHGNDDKKETKKKPCDFFSQRGSCTKGENCRFSHDVPESQPQVAAEDEAEPEAEATAEPEAEVEAKSAAKSQRVDLCDKTLSPKLWMRLLSQLLTPEEGVLPISMLEKKSLNVFLTNGTKFRVRPSLQDQVNNLVKQKGATVEVFPPFFRSFLNREKEALIPCKNFASGSCERGEKCYFSHSSDVKSAETPEPAKVSPKTRAAPEPAKAPPGTILATDLMAILNMGIGLEAKDRLIRTLVEAALQQ
jgi:hypothetical protein